MNIHRVLSLFILAILFGCYPGITGRVIDAETQQPIDGAAVLALWIKTHGAGLTDYTVYKLAEAETNNEGKFSISGVYSPFVDPPEVLIYKKGYVAWRNDYVFPGFKKRTDYDIWQNHYVYKLEKFKEGYSREEHRLYVSLGMFGFSNERTATLNNIFDETFEETQQEIRVRQMKNMGGSPY